MALSHNITPPLWYSTLTGSNKYDVFHILWRQNGAEHKGKWGKRSLAERKTHILYNIQGIIEFQILSNCRNCAYLVVLIRSHGNEIRFRENISSEGAVREFENIVGPHNVKSRLIFVHRVKYGLQNTQHTQNDTFSPQSTALHYTLPQNG